MRVVVEGRNNKKYDSTNLVEYSTHIKNRPGRKGEEEEDEAGRSRGAQGTIQYFLGEDQKEGEEPESQGNKIIFFYARRRRTVHFGVEWTNKNREN